MMSAYDLDNSVKCRPDISNQHSDGDQHARLCRGPQSELDVTHSEIVVHDLSLFLIDLRDITYDRGTENIKLLYSE
jgi:hypothetical protein